MTIVMSKTYLVVYLVLLLFLVFYLVWFGMETLDYKHKLLLKLDGVDKLQVDLNRNGGGDESEIIIQLKTALSQAKLELEQLKLENDQKRKNNVNDTNGINVKNLEAAYQKSFPPNSLLHKSHSKKIIQSGQIDGIVRSTENTDWIKYVLPAVPRVIYHRARGPPYKYGATHTIIEGTLVTQYLIPNVGFEALSYLQYCYEYYDSLPDFSIFLHAHEESIHSKHVQQYIQDLNTNYFNSTDPLKQIVNLNWDVYFDDDNERWSLWQVTDTSDGGVRSKIIHLYYKYVEHWFGPMPKLVSFYCCAQFVVTRRGIRNMPREFYKAQIDWLEGQWGEDKDTSRFFEYFWYRIFSGEMRYPKIDPCDFLRNKDCDKYSTQRGLVFKTDVDTRQPKKEEGLLHKLFG